MEIRQRLELRRLMVPELKQSLKILALPLPDLKELVEEELVNNPFLEEVKDRPKPLTTSFNTGFQSPENLEDSASLVTKKASLQDVLLRQLGMFANTDVELKIGQEIIGNIDENGYLKADLEEISRRLWVYEEEVLAVLKLIQQFEPAGVAARDIQECLSNQLDLKNDGDQLTRKIICGHLDDIAKKNLGRICKCLDESRETVESCVKKILHLDPKPGRNYSPEHVHNIIPDIVIREKSDDELDININNEDMPTLAINKDYKLMLKDPLLKPETKEFLRAKLLDALELLRAVSKRYSTLRKVIDVIAEIQAEAVREGLSKAKPLTFQEVAQRIGMHESTVCRVIMNKYCQTPAGVVALKDFFTSHIHAKNGESISSNFVKRRIKDLIDAEDKKNPLSDEELAAIILKENSLKVARRTVAKYREELKLLSSVYRKIR